MSACVNIALRRVALASITLSLLLGFAIAIPISRSEAAAASSSPAALSLERSYKLYRLQQGWTGSQGEHGGKDGGSTAAVPGSWREALRGIPKEELLPLLREKLFSAKEFCDAQFAADCLCLWGAPDEGMAEVLLEYLRREDAFAWSVSPYLRRLMTPDQARRLADRLTDYPADSEVVLVEVISALDGFTRETLGRLLRSAERRPALFGHLLWVAEGLFAGGEQSKGGIIVDASREREFLAWVDEVYPSISSSAGKGLIIDRILSQARREGPAMAGVKSEAVKWLKARAGSETDRQLKQQLMYDLYTLGLREYLPELVRDVDRQGVGKGIRFTRDGYFLKDVRERHPSSFLSRGMAAYEEVRGEPYLMLDRIEKAERGEYGGIHWPYYYGDGQYRPDVEIPGWTRFLESYSGHPGADDAAYRLGRSYEIKGDYLNALNALDTALELPDGDCWDDAAGRIVYIMDAVMPTQELESIDKSRLHERLRPLIDYSLAVRRLRQDDYRGALSLIRGFLDRNPRPWSPMMGYHGYDTLYYYGGDPYRAYDLAGKILEQARAVSELAELKERLERDEKSAGSDRWAVLYELAAKIYHNPLMYYNHLWCGQRASYRWMQFLESAWFNDLSPSVANYLKGMINYYHAKDAFEKVAESEKAPPELRAKALYSVGLCYVGIDQWGSEVELIGEDVAGQVVSTYRDFIARFPDSSMADDAMLVVGVYTGDLEYLRSIKSRYPGGDRIEDVGRLLADQSWLRWRPNPLERWKRVLYSDVTSSVLPLPVAAWVDSHKGESFLGHMTTEGYTYVLISLGARPTAGYLVAVDSVTADENGDLTVRWREVPPYPGRAVAQVVTYPYRLIKIAGSHRDVRIEQVK